MQLDLFGSAVIVVLAVGFVLLLIGVYPSKLRENALNLVKHGIFSSIAIIVTLISVFVVMTPIFVKIAGAASLANLFQFPVMWLHAVLGAVTISLALVMIAIWLRSPIGELGCAKTWRLMKPTLFIWAAALALGVFLSIYGLR